MAGEWIIGNMIARLASDVRGFKTDLGEAGKSVQTLEKNVNSSGKNIRAGLSQVSQGAAGIVTNLLPIVTAAGAVAGGFKFLKSSMEDTVEYAKNVKELSLITGLTADASSRLIQIADDWEISAQELTTALGMMVKNGVVPTIDNLAQLADKYVNAKDKTEFAAEATQLLGRQWETLIPILALGGNALRKAYDEVDKGLIMTDEMIVKSRNYTVAVDNMNDKLNILQMTIGFKLVPKVTDLITVLTELFSLPADNWFLAGANAAAKFINSFFGLTKAVQAAVSSVPATGTVSKVRGGGGTKRRQSGGSVTGGLSYMVGETGPEIFMPRISGQILPTAEAGGGGVYNEGDTVTINNYNQKAAALNTAMLFSGRQQRLNGFMTSG